MAEPFVNEDKNVDTVSITLSGVKLSDIAKIFNDVNVDSDVVKKLIENVESIKRERDLALECSSRYSDMLGQAEESWESYKKLSDTLLNVINDINELDDNKSDSDFRKSVRSIIDKFVDKVKSNKNCSDENIHSQRAFQFIYEIRTLVPIIKNDMTAEDCMKVRDALIKYEYGIYNK